MSLYQLIEKTPLSSWNDKPYRNSQWLMIAGAILVLYFKGELFSLGGLILILLALSRTSQPSLSPNSRIWFDVILGISAFWLLTSFNFIIPNWLSMLTIGLISQSIIILALPLMFSLWGLEHTTLVATDLVLLVAVVGSRIRGRGYTDEMAQETSSTTSGLAHSQTFASQQLRPFVKPHVLEEFDAGVDPNKFSFKEQELTIMFTNMRNYASLAMHSSNEEVYEILSRYFDLVGNQVNSSKGEVEKLMGDGLMATFQEPNMALNCYVKIQADLQAINLNRIKEGLFPLNFGTSLTHGKVLEGNFGGSIFRDRTIIGSIVSDTMQLNQISKKYDLNVLATENFVNQLKNYNMVRMIDEMQTKHTKQPIKIFEVFEHMPPEVIEYNLAMRDNLEEIIELKAAGRYRPAMTLLDELIAECPSHKFKKDTLMDPFLKSLRHELDYLEKSATEAA